jgi:cobalt/nickel transport system permease protein
MSALKHLAVERWSRQTSAVHGLDARAKMLTALAVLLSITLSESPAVHGACFVLVAVLALAARLPLWALLLRGLVVVPFVGGIALLNLWGGDAGRAGLILLRAYLSAYTVVLVLATTPFPKLLAGLESLGVPRFFLMVLQFLYRYLFVLYEQAQNMRRARACRAARPRGQQMRKSAAGAIAVLFARSHGRAEGIHRAMLARGFDGHFRLLEIPRFAGRDWLFVSVCAVLLVSVHAAVRWLPPSLSAYGQGG